MNHPLLPKLKKLRLGGMAQTLDDRSRQAQEKGLTPTEFLALLLDDEHERRGQDGFRRAVKEAGLEEGKTLSSFDFGTSQVSKGLIMDLAMCRYVEKGAGILFYGGTGTGKSHLAQGLAYEGIKKGYKALYRPTHVLLGAVNGSRSDGSYQRLRHRLANVEILILDDFGLVPLTTQGAEDLYEIIRDRYERKSIILTSNRDPGEWMEIFKNDLLGSAALDRLTHHSQEVKLTGPSYRQEERRRRQKKAGDRPPS